MRHFGGFDTWVNNAGVSIFGRIEDVPLEEARRMFDINFWGLVHGSLAAVRHLKQSSKKVAVGGFCMGGALTLLAALRVPEMDAGACFYGLPPVEAAEFKKIQIPLICHFANQDDWCTPVKVTELENMLKQSKSKFEVYRYDAKHAFMNEMRPEVYEEGSAKLAWDRTLSFLKKALA